MRSVIFIVLFLTFASQAQIKVGKEFKFTTAEKSYSIKKLVKNIWQIKNESASVAKEVNFSVYLPVSQTSYQFCQSIESSHAGKLYKDELGNQVFTIHIKQMAPYSTFALRLKSNLLMSSKAVTHKDKNKENFLKAEKFIESKDQAILKVARQVKGISSKDTADKSFIWVTKRIAKSEYTSEAKGALYALNQKKGDCTEHTFLMAAILRASNIPARIVGGYVVQNNRVLRAREYHNWLEYNLSDYWEISDPFNKNHDKNKDHFIAFKIDGGKSENLMKGNHRYLISDTNLKVLMEY